MYFLFMLLSRSEIQKGIKKNHICLFIGLWNFQSQIKHIRSDKVYIRSCMIFYVYHRHANLMHFKWIYLRITFYGMSNLKCNIFPYFLSKHWVNFVHYIFSYLFWHKMWRGTTFYSLLYIIYSVFYVECIPSFHFKQNIFKKFHWL